MAEARVAVPKESNLEGQHKELQNVFCEPSVSLEKSKAAVKGVNHQTKILQS
jgi:hypothetical protein